VNKDLKLKRGSIFCFRSNPFLKRVVITPDRSLVKLSTGKVAIKPFFKKLADKPVFKRVDFKYPAGKSEPVRKK